MIKKGICTKAEAEKLLEISSKELYNKLKDPGCRLIKSKMKGKYIYSSVIAEFERIHGFKYHKACV